VPPLSRAEAIATNRVPVQTTCWNCTPETDGWRGARVHPVGVVGNGIGVGSGADVVGPPDGEAGVTDGAVGSGTTGPAEQATVKATRTATARALAPRPVDRRRERLVTSSVDTIWLLGRRLAGLVIGTALFAVGVAFIMPALLSLAVSRVPAGERGTVVGTATLFIDVSFGIAPVVLGAVAQLGGYALGFVVAGVVSLLGAVLLALGSRPGPVPSRDATLGT
jgi:hypothetical protein